MSILDEFRRVSRRHPCPICGRPDWCLIERRPPVPGDEPRVLCQRIESPVRWREAGWLHGPRQDPGVSGKWVRPVAPPPSDEPRARVVDLSGLMLKFQRGVDPVALTDLASSLGVSEHALRRLEIGRARGAWAFPMRAAAGGLVGFRLRTDAGRKLAIRGSRQGLFIPQPPPSHPDADDRETPLFIAEGPTDTAALLDVGVDAIGRPSCTGAAGLCAEFVQLHRRWRPVVLIADNDEPGRRGAEALARALRDRGVRTTVLMPPEGVKDAREWKRRGLKRKELGLGDGGKPSPSPGMCDQDGAVYGQPAK